MKDQDISLLIECHLVVKYSSVPSMSFKPGQTILAVKTTFAKLLERP